MPVIAAKAGIDEASLLTCYVSAEQTVHGRPTFGRRTPSHCSSRNGLRAIGEVQHVDHLCLASRRSHGGLSVGPAPRPRPHPRDPWLCDAGSSACVLRDQMCMNPTHITRGEHRRQWEPGHRGGGSRLDPWALRPRLAPGVLLTYRTVLTARSRKNFAGRSAGDASGAGAGSFLLHESTRRGGRSGQRNAFFRFPRMGDGASPPSLETRPGSCTALLKSQHDAPRPLYAAR